MNYQAKFSVQLIEVLDSRWAIMRFLLVVALAVSVKAQRYLSQNFLIIMIYGCFAVDVHSGTFQTQLVHPVMLVAVPQWRHAPQMSCTVVTMVLATICGGPIKELLIPDMLDYCLLNMEIVNRNFLSKNCFFFNINQVLAPQLSLKVERLYPMQGKFPWQYFRIYKL